MRTSWLFGFAGQNFVKTMLRLGRERDSIKVVQDQVVCPTWTGHLARAVAVLVERSGTRDGAMARGTFHYCGHGMTNWYEFARTIIEEGTARGPTRPVPGLPTSTAEYPTAAARPRYSVLDCSRITAEHGIEPTPWREGLVAVLDRLCGQA